MRPVFSSWPRRGRGMRCWRVPQSSSMGPVRQADDSARATICSWRKINRPTRLRGPRIGLGSRLGSGEPERGLSGVAGASGCEYSPGDRVELRLIDGTADPGEPPMYEAVRIRATGPDLIVGRTHKNFRRRAVCGRMGQVADAHQAPHRRDPGHGGHVPRDRPARRRRASTAST